MCRSGLGSWAFRVLVKEGKEGDVLKWLWNGGSISHLLARGARVIFTFFSLGWGRDFSPAFACSLASL